MSQNGGGVVKPKDFEELQSLGKSENIHLFIQSTKR
jgi:hypothetical protein